jgi:general secretion pathway protein I
VTVYSGSIEEEGQSGFTLIEVLVAIAIFSVGFAVLANVISNSRSLGLRAENMSRAVSLAQSVMARVGADIPVKPSYFEGEVANGFRWELTVQPDGTSGFGRARGVGAYVVRINVAWKEGSHEKQYELVTLRLGAIEPRR